MDGNVNVIVSDGFTGNVALKTAEGVASLCSNYIKNIFENMKFLPDDCDTSILRNLPS